MVIKIENIYSLVESWLNVMKTEYLILYSVSSPGYLLTSLANQ